MGNQRRMKTDRNGSCSLDLIKNSSPKKRLTINSQSIQLLRMSFRLAKGDAGRRKYNLFTGLLIVGLLLMRKGSSTLIHVGDLFLPIYILYTEASLSWLIRNLHYYSSSIKKLLRMHSFVRWFRLCWWGRRTQTEQQQTAPKVQVRNLCSGTWAVDHLSQN